MIPFTNTNWIEILQEIQKQPFRVVLWKRCSENMQQIYRRIPMLSFTEIALRHGCSPLNLLHIFRTPFFKNTSEGLLLKIAIDYLSEIIFSC